MRIAIVHPPLFCHVIGALVFVCAINQAAPHPNQHRVCATAWCTGICLFAPQGPPPHRGEMQGVVMALGFFGGVRYKAWYPHRAVCIVELCAFNRFRIFVLLWGAFVLYTFRGVRGSGLSS